MVALQSEPGTPPVITPIPLLAALEQNLASGRLSFHMPGHRNGASWPQAMRNSLARLDTTELACTDDLHQPTGPVLAAMQAAADYFGSGRTFLITTGSTVGLLALLAGTVGRGGRLLLARTCHQSIVHALALLTIEPVWILPEPWQPTSFGLLPPVSALAVTRALRQNQDIQAVLITSPDYYGTCSDLPGIAAAAHAAGAMLLVDEAHGAHLAGAPAWLPPTALASDADACVQSAHKTLPALTQGAYLHLSRQAVADQRIDPERIAAMLRVFQTSSPSFAIAASLDFARFFLASEGQTWIGQQLEHIAWLQERLAPRLSVSPPNRQSLLADQPGQPASSLRDPLRLVISLKSTDWTGIAATSWLSARMVDVEMADLSRLVLIPALDQPAADFTRLADLLDQMVTGPPAASLGWPSAGCLNGATAPSDYTVLEQLWADQQVHPPELAVSPGELLFPTAATPRTVCRIPLSQAVSRIAARAITPYPPGIPLIWPGERISDRQVELLRQLGDNHINQMGLTSGETGQESLLVLA